VTLAGSKRALFHRIDGTLTAAALASPSQVHRCKWLKNNTIAV
jgi:hypothetical protein